MKKKYQIEINEVREWLDNQGDIPTKSDFDYYNENTSICATHLKKQFERYISTTILDGKGISDIFFPTKFRSRFKIFISHSGEDKEIVKAFVNVLERNYSTPCFVDWMVWGNIEDLQSIIDNNLCNPTKKSNGGCSYDYKLRNQTTAHTHTMLSMALLDMIVQCDIFLFIKSYNSTIPEANFGDIRTLSPWIYEEISYINHIANIEEKTFSINEGSKKQIIAYPLDLTSFNELKASSLEKKLSLRPL